MKLKMLKNLPYVLYQGEKEIAKVLRDIEKSCRTSVIIVDVTTQADSQQQKWELRGQVWYSERHKCWFCASSKSLHKFEESSVLRVYLQQYRRVA